MQQYDYQQTSFIKCEICCSKSFSANRLFGSLTANCCSESYLVKVANSQSTSLFCTLSFWKSFMCLILLSRACQVRMVRFSLHVVMSKILFVNLNIAKGTTEPNSTLPLQNISRKKQTKLQLQILPELQLQNPDQTLCSKSEKSLGF